MLKQGKYIIGDMCYLFDDETWQSMCSNQMADLGCNMISFEVEGVTCHMSCTAYGDGRYDWYNYSSNIEMLNNCHNFPVDAGLLGIISVDILDKNVTKLDYEELQGIGYLMLAEFKKPFDVDYTDGKFTFGDLEVDTDDRYDYDDYEDDFE